MQSCWQNCELPRIYPSESRGTWRRGIRQGYGMAVQKMNKALLSLLALCPVATAFADGSDNPWKITGFAEGYYGSSSPDQGKGLTRFGRMFDGRNEQFRLSAAQLNFLYTDPKGRFSALISPFIGDNADTLYLTEPKSSNLVKHLAQAYVTWNIDKNGKTLDFGKFYSWIGYEKAESMDNDVYSRGLLATLGQPVYHYGVRFNMPFNERWGLTLAATEGWNQTESEASGMSFGGQLRYKASDRTNVALNVITGEEGDTNRNNGGTHGGIGLGNNGLIQTDLVDLVLTHQLNSRTKLGFNFTNVNLEVDSFDTTWTGWALHVAHQWNDKLSFGARIESFSDEDGLRLGTSDTSANSFTICANYKLNTLFTLRGEYRKDFAKDEIFTTTNGFSKNQGTFNISLGVRF